ncbi:MAG: hypothetical protein WBI07_18125 [Mobilitalea sp.]
MSIILKTERLSVEIAEPGEFPNTTTRFDRSGFVVQVTLDNQFAFCTKEPDKLTHPSTGGVGLCSEYQLSAPADEAAKGTQFPKMGVGLLTKEEEGGYVFHYPYPCEPYEINYTKTDTLVRFETKPNPCQGYAASHAKTLEVVENELIMTMEVENVGTKPLVFDEYCHNFMTLEHLPIGDQFYIGMSVAPQDGKTAKDNDVLIGSGNGFTFSRYSSTAVMISAEKDQISEELPFQWKLTNQNSPAWVSESVSVKPNKISIWSIDHIISPEVFCHFDLALGEKATWSRKWTFNCN